MKIKRKFRCRIEEVTVIGGFVYDSFLLDKKDFTDYSEPEFSGSFADDYKKEMKEIDELIAPKNITRKMKVVTSHLYKTISDFRKPLNALEGYVNMAAKKSSSSAPGASSLTVLPKDFGIQTMRQALANHDTEEILGSFKTLLQNINDNRDLLKTKGYKDALHNQLLSLRDALNEDNNQQNIITDERDKKVEDNMGAINNFWTERITLTANTGRNILYKDTAKADEYTITSLINRIRQERKKQKTTQPK